MCGLPTETDDDVMQIAEMAKHVIKAGREAAGRKDIRCTISIGAFVPKPHTPFQWAAQLDHETVDRRLKALKAVVMNDRNYGKAIGIRYHGWSEHFSYDRWERCAAEVFAGTPVSLDWYTTREREHAEVLPWDHL